MGPEQATVRVTEEDIRQGTPGNPVDCPGARGARRAFPEAAECVMGVGRLFVIWDAEADPRMSTYSVNDAGRRLIHLVDSGAAVEPGEFQVTRQGEGWLD